MLETFAFNRRLRESERLYVFKYFIYASYNIASKYVKILTELCERNIPKIYAFSSDYSIILPSSRKKFYTWSWKFVFSETQKAEQRERKRERVRSRQNLLVACFST